MLPLTFDGMNACGQLGLLAMMIFLIMYFWWIRRRRNVLAVPTFSKAEPARIAPEERKYLLDAAMVEQPMRTASSGRIGFPSWQTRFPSSPIMPDANVIDGTAPFHPDIGKEWAEVSFPYVEASRSG